MKLLILVAVLSIMAVDASAKPGAVIVSPGYGYGYAAYKPSTVIIPPSASYVVTPGFKYGYGYGYPGYGFGYPGYGYGYKSYAYPGYSPYYGYGYAKYW